MKFLSYEIIAVVIIALFLNSELGCHDNGVQPREATIQLSLVKDSVSAVWLRVTIIDLSEPREFQLKRDSIVVAAGRIPSQDTIIADRTVIQTQTYNYKAYRVGSNGFIDSSDAVQVTLGHGWRIDTLTYVGVGQLTLEQLWGLKSDRLFAVGHNSNGYRGLMTWDGNVWQLFLPYPGSVSQRWTDVHGIWGMSERDLWVVGQMVYSIYDTTLSPPAWRDTDSAFVAHWDGSVWTQQNVTGGRTLFHIWGSGETDIYAGGWKSSLFHFDGSQWTKLSSDTTMDFTRIWGRSSAEVYCIGRRLDPAISSKAWMYFIQLSPSSYTILDSTLENSNLLSTKFGTIGIWGTATTTYSWGYGVFKKTGNSWTEIVHPPWQVGDVRGTSDQRLFAVGSLGGVFEYDGNEWKRPDQFPSIFPTVQLASIWVDEQEIFLLGFDQWTSYVYHYK